MKSNTNWIVEQGKVEFNNKTIKFKTLEIKDQTGKKQLQSAIIASNIYFENGTIKFKVRLNSIDALCQIILNSETDLPIIGVGFNTSGIPLGIQKLVNSRWEILNGTGVTGTINPAKEYEVTIKIIGSTIELYVDEILVCKATHQITKSQLKLLLNGKADFEIKDFTVDQFKPKAFVIMQFSEDFNELYEEVIKPVTEEFNLICERADEYHTTNPIIQDIVNSIKDASIVIADITPDNPNVFYEVGYSHAIGKPTILLSNKKREKLPFDVSSFRTLFYDNTIAGKTVVEKRLRKFLENIF